MKEVSGKISNGSAAAALKYHPLGKKPKPVQVEPSVSSTSLQANAVDAVWTKKVQYLALLIILGLVILGFVIACGVDWIYKSYYESSSSVSDDVASVVDEHQNIAESGGSEEYFTTTVTKTVYYDSSSEL